jgi:hypothetical protein
MDRAKHNYCSAWLVNGGVLRDGSVAHTAWVGGEQTPRPRHAASDLSPVLPFASAAACALGIGRTGSQLGRTSKQKVPV